MYVKLYNQILDSSIAENRRLRHFFIDLLLCCDRDGNVIMTPEAIKRKTGADIEEVLWGLSELSKPDPSSLSPDNDGRRIAPLDGHGYGWRVLNYARYRDIKSENQMREESAERQRRWREKHKNDPKKTPEEAFDEARKKEYGKRRKPGVRAARHAGACAGAKKAIDDGLNEANAEIQKEQQEASAAAGDALHTAEVTPEPSVEPRVQEPAEAPVAQNESLSSEL